MTPNQPNAPLNPYQPGFPLYSPPVPFTSPPPRVWPVPAGKVAPLVWAVVVTLLTLGAVALAAIAPSQVVAPPPAGPSVIYASSLAQPDNAWLLHSTQGAGCSFANGGLDAVATPPAAQTGTLYALCELSGVPAGNLRVSVRIAPQAQLANTLYPAIFLHQAIAVVITPLGVIDVFRLDTHQMVTSIATNEWYGYGQRANTLIVASKGSVYTIALNGDQVYQGDFGGVSEQLSFAGDLALGVDLPLGASGASEALYTNLSVTGS